MNTISPDQVRQMRDWVKDCQWAEDFDDDEVDALSDSEIVQGVNRSYDGGVRQFLADSVPA